jgi:hypothetical protein
VLTFPLVLFLHAVLLPYLRGERAPAAPLIRGGTLWREIILTLPNLVITGFVYVWYQRTLAQVGLFDRGYTAHGLAHLWNLERINPLVFWIYLKQIFLPSHLAVLYPWPVLQPSYPLWQVVVALASTLAAGGAGLWLFCRRKDLFFYFAAFFVLMIPYLNLIFIGIWVADRYVYFSSFCVLALAISVSENVWQQSQRAVRLSLVLIGAAFLASNLFQTLTYQPAWKNGETLWQYHISQPQHSTIAYDNLAAYYYADFGDAVAKHDQPRMAASLDKMSVVIDAGLAEYWRDRQQPPPIGTYFLFFLRSLIQEVTGQPEAALASLLMSDQLHPRFDSTNLNLSRVYHKLATTTADPQQRETYRRAARDRYADYVRLLYRDRPPPPEVQAEMASLAAECAVPQK